MCWWYMWACTFPQMSSQLADDWKGSWISGATFWESIRACTCTFWTVVRAISVVSCVIDTWTSHSHTQTHRHTPYSIIVVYYWCSQNIPNTHTYTSCRFSSKSSFISQWKPIFSGVCAALRGSCGAICEWFERSEGNWILMTDALFGLQHYTHIHTRVRTHTHIHRGSIHQSITWLRLSTCGDRMVCAPHSNRHTHSSSVCRWEDLLM